MDGDKSHGATAGLFVLAAAAYAGLTALFTNAAVLAMISAVWPLIAGAAAITLVTIDSLFPSHASPARQWSVAALFVALQALATAPMAWTVVDSGGLALLGAWLSLTALTVGGLAAFAARKSSSVVEPVDIPLAIALTVVANVIVALCFALPFGAVVGSLLSGVFNVFVLARLCSALIESDLGRSGRAGLQVFTCVVVVATDVGITLLTWPRWIEFVEGWLAGC